MALVLVTGASTGLGLAAAAELADRGHDVVLHARAADRVEDRLVLDRMRAAVYGDLSDMEQVVRVGDEADRIGRFDAVIHNAGAMRGRDVFAVNTVAPYLLTAVMTAPRRIIVLSSGMHLSGSADLAGIDLADATGRAHAYQDSKLHVTALAMALAVRRPESLVHAVDPGWVPTRMGGPAATDDLAEGHRTQVWLATADAADIAPRSGGYWYHRATRPAHPAATDPAFQAELLRRLEVHTGTKLSD